MLWKVQSSLPVFTSKARTRPLVLFMRQGWEPSLKDEPTITMLFTTVGVVCRPISPVVEIDLLVYAGLAGHAGIGADFHIDHAVIAEGFDRPAGMGIEFDQAIAGGDVEDAVIAIAVGPIGHAAAGKLARRDRRRARLHPCYRPISVRRSWHPARPRRGANRRWCRPCR